ncbi:MAG: tetratricopeptide repeat protein [Streptosporangiales bacterium]
MNDHGGPALDYFEALGIPRGAAAEEISRRVKQELRTWQKRTSNPDLARRQEAEKKVQLLSEAKEVLLDDARRAAYLRRLERGPSEPEPEPRPEPAPQPGGQPAPAPRQRPAPQPPQDGIDWVGQAFDYLAKRDHRSAVYAAREARERDPRSAAAWSVLARANLGLGNADDALFEMQRAIELAPNYLQFHLDLGGIHEALGQWDDAAGVYSSAADLDRSDERPRLAAANAWMQAGKPAQARPVLEDIVERGHDKQAAGVALGNCLITLAELVPRYRDGSNYFVTSKAEIARMRGLVQEAERVTDDPDVRDRAGDVRGYLRWCERRQWHVATGLMRRFLLVVLGLAVALVIAGVTWLGDELGTGVTAFVLAAGILVLLYFNTRVPGWKRNRKRLRYRGDH